MVITKLHISNYKIYEGENTIIFPESNVPVVFVGVNGAGKTTIIEAITGCFWEYYYKIQGKRKAKDDRFNKSNINLNSQEYATVKLDWEANENHPLTSGFEIRKTINPTYKHLGTKAIDEYTETLKGDVGFYKEEANIPLIVYYPVERTVLNPSLKATNIATDNQFDAYNNAFDKSVNFNQFFEWFRSAEDLENEIRLNKNASYADKGLDAVRKAILSFLEDFTKIRVKRTVQTTLILEKEGKAYEVNQLSHGEKAIIAMIGDLARRLVIANPGLKAPLHGKGIVMIDELDLHLHPKWQRTILKKLRNTFPKIQFICTTHSPLVINHLSKESIYLLENGKCTPLKNKYQDFNTYGADIEDILKLVQGTDHLMPNEIEAKFNTLSKFIQQGEIEKANAIIEELKEVSDPNHAELRKAVTQIKYKKLLGKK